MELRFLKKFVRLYDKSDKKIRSKVDIVIEKFVSDPFDVTLHNHPLQGDRQGQRTINVTGDRRIVFKELSNGKYELVELIELGTHSQLY